MLVFGLCSTSDDRPGWSINSNPVCHPSPAKKIKCSFSDYIQLLMISRAGQWTRTPSATPLQSKKWNACFWLHSTSDDWLGWSMDSNPICHPSSANKIKCLFLDYVSTSDDRSGLSIDSNPIATPLQPKKWNAHFQITFNFWWSVNGLKPHSPALSRQNNEMLVFGLCSTSDDWPGWLMDSNPICHPSPAKKIKCLFLDYVSTSDDRPGWLIDSNPICHPSPAQKMKCSFSDYVQLLMIFNGLKPHSPPLSSQRNEMLCFWIMFNFWWWPGWLMDSNPIHHPSRIKKIKCSFLDYVQLLMIGRAGRWTLTPVRHPSPAKKMKCSFSDYVQLLMISWAGRWTQTPSATPLQPKKWNACFWIMFNFW